MFPHKKKRKQSKTSGMFLDNLGNYRLTEPRDKTMITWF